MNPTPDLLTFRQLSEMTDLHVKTLQRYASKRRPISKRLRVVRLSRKTVLVRPTDWQMFLAAGEAQKGY